MNWLKRFLKRFEFRMQLGKGTPTCPFPKEPSDLPNLKEIKSLQELKNALQKSRDN